MHGRKSILDFGKRRVWRVNESELMRSDCFLIIYLSVFFLFFSQLADNYFSVLVFTSSV